MDLTYIRVHGKRRFVLPQSISGRRPVSPMQCSFDASTLVVPHNCTGGPAGDDRMQSLPANSESLSTDSEWHEFQGTWTAAGSRTGISLGDGRRASTAKFEGSLVLAGPSRPAVGFPSGGAGSQRHCTGLIGRAVWTDDRGDQVFSELTGNGTSTGNKLVGTFVGGTGRYSGASGSYEFSWRFVLETEDGQVQGQSMGLNGTIHVGSAQAALDAGGPR